MRNTGENVGTYAVNQGTLALSTNYVLTFISASLAISPAPLTVTAVDAGRTYGRSNPSFDAVYSGFMNGDSLGSLTGALKFITAATQQSGVGTYAITPSGLSSPNYAISFKNGTLTISPTSLTISPDGGKSKTYGAIFTAFTGAISGLQNGDTVAMNYASSGAVAGAAVGSYDVTVANYSFTSGSASNYTVTKSTATNGLIVNPATLTIMPDGGKTKKLGQAFSGFTGTIAGLQNSDAATATYTSAGAPATAAVGTYDISAASVTFTSGSASNYVITKGTATKGLTVSYNACLLYDPNRAVKSGATYPVKLYLCDINGMDVSSAAIVVNATGMYQNSSFAGVVEDAGSANPDSNFRYDSTLGPSGGYIFNLKTGGLNTGSFTLTFTAGGVSNSSYAAVFGVK